MIKTSNTQNANMLCSYQKNCHLLDKFLWLNRTRKPFRDLCGGILDKNLPIYYADHRGMCALNDAPFCVDGNLRHIAIIYTLSVNYCSDIFFQNCNITLNGQFAFTLTIELHIQNIWWKWDKTREECPFTATVYEKMQHFIKTAFYYRLML